MKTLKKTFEKKSPVAKELKSGAAAVNGSFGEDDAMPRSRVSESGDSDFYREPAAQFYDEQDEDDKFWNVEPQRAPNNEDLWIVNNSKQLQ